jgi:hypothetical protein
MTTTPPIPATPAATAKTLACPVCDRQGENENCSLCRGTQKVSGEYSIGTGFQFCTDRQTAWLLNCPGGCAAVMLCAGGTTFTELYHSLSELIERSSHGMSKHLAEQWRELRKAKADIEGAMRNRVDGGSTLVYGNAVFRSWADACAALATFEQQHGIGGGT